MARELFTNLGISYTGSGTVSPTDLAIPVIGGVWPASGNFTIRVGFEFMLVTAVTAVTPSGYVFTVTRAQEGTAAGTYTTGTTVFEVLTGGSISRLLVQSKNGTPVAARREVNFVEGTGVTLTLADNPGNDRVDCTINRTPPQWDRNSVGVASRSNLNLIEGANVSISMVDNPAGDRVDCTIALAGGGASGIYWDVNQSGNGSTRPNVSFNAGTNVSISRFDNPAANRVDYFINSVGSVGPQGPQGVPGTPGAAGAAVFTGRTPVPPTLGMFTTGSNNCTLSASPNGVALSQPGYNFGSSTPFSNVGTVNAVTAGNTALLIPATAGALATCGLHGSGGYFYKGRGVIGVRVASLSASIEVPCDPLSCLWMRIKNGDFQFGNDGTNWVTLFSAFNSDAAGFFVDAYRGSGPSLVVSATLLSWSTT